MTQVFCDADDCMWCEGGFCKNSSIVIGCDWECGSYEHYRSSYIDQYYEACSKDGKTFRRLVKNGKKIEYNGYVFYTKNRICPDGYYWLTEERTGIGVGQFAMLKDRWDKFLERIVTYPDVSTYPLKESEDTE